MSDQIQDMDVAAGLNQLVAGKAFAVLGLGRSGLATAQALHAAGAEVTAWDDNNQPQDVPFRVAPLDDADMQSFAGLVMSPGIPHTYPRPHPVADAAKRAGVPLISDIELLMAANAQLPSEVQRRFIGITGTNGKSTTTELIAHIVKETGVPFSVGGNLGPAALSLSDPGQGGVYVLEMSSYQLELLDTAQFDVSAFLNLTPDHLERHGGVEGYTAAKRNIFTHLKPSGCAVICVDQPIGEAFAHEFESQALRVSTHGATDVSAVDGQLVEGDFCFELNELSKFPGQHNWQNFAIAFATTRQLGLTAEQIVGTFPSFGGLAHRQEVMGDIGKIRFVNDSKGTNPEAAEVALNAYENVFWIVGGLAKAEGIDPLLPLMDRVAKAYLIGESTDAFAAVLAGKVDHDLSRTMEVAVQQAFADASNAADLHNPVILLSPACASFDQYRSFEVRGDHFRELYEQIKTKAET